MTSMPWLLTLPQPLTPLTMTVCFGSCIMYNIGFPTDAIDAVRNLYEHATTQLEVNLLASKFPFQGMHKQNTHRKGYYTRRHSPFSLPTLYGAPLPCACIGRMVLRGSDFCSRPAELPRYFWARTPLLIWFYVGGRGFTHACVPKKSYRVPC
jgi:hypothetical protein